MCKDMQCDASERLVELEIKLAFQDDLVDKLNETVARQQSELTLLQKEVRLLWQMLKQSQAGHSGEAGFSLRDEIPPHY